MTAYGHLLNDAGQIDRTKVFALAIKFAQHERAGFVKFGGKSWSECMGYGLRKAWADAKSAHRTVVVNPAYRASLDPVELAARGHETRLAVLRNNIIGKQGYARRSVEIDIARHEAALGALCAPLAIAAE